MKYTSWKALITRSALVLLLQILLSAMVHAAATPVERLAQGVRFQTISYQDYSRIDFE